MFPLGRRLALACACVLAALVVAGCGGGGNKPVSLPSLSPSDSPTPTATSTTDPQTAAVSVVRAYYGVINSLRQKMDATALAVLMTNDCTCQQQVRAIRSAAAKGERYVDHARLVSLTPALNSPTSVDVLVEYDASAGGLVDSQGRRITSAPAKKGLKRLFHVRYASGSWLIAEIDDA